MLRWSGGGDLPAPRKAVTVVVGVQMQVRWLRQPKNHTEYEEKLSQIAPRNVGVKVESRVKSISK